VALRFLAAILPNSDDLDVPGRGEALYGGFLRFAVRPRSALLVRGQIARLAPVEDGLRNIRDEIAEADAFHVGGVSK
jgi:hypothetical protein